MTVVALSLGWLWALPALVLLLGPAEGVILANCAAGVICLAKPGDRVEAGQPVLELRADEETRFGRAVSALDGAIEVGDQPPTARPLVVERITA